jgi:hypothetical protein
MTFMYGVAGYASNPGRKKQRGCERYKLSFQPEWHSLLLRMGCRGGWPILPSLASSCRLMGPTLTRGLVETSVSTAALTAGSVGT